MQVVVFIDGHHALFQELIPGWLTTKTSSRLKKTGSLAVLGHCYARDSQYKVTLPFAQAGTYHVVSHISWYQSKLLFSATMVIDCDADIRSSTSPSTKKFKPSTNRATPWTSSSLTRSHDSPSQVAPSLYLATQTAISVWIKRRFGNFLVWNGYIFCCFCLLVFPLTYAPLYSCSSCGGACVDSCSYSASCNASLKTSLWPTSSSSALVEQKISNNLASDAAPYSYSCSSSSFPEICSFSAPDGPGHPGAHLKNIDIRYVCKK